MADTKRDTHVWWSGEVIPAAKIKVTKDGLLDVETESRNSGTIIDIKCVN